MIPRQEEFYSVMKIWAEYLYRWYLRNPNGDPALANAYYDGEAAAFKLEHFGLAQYSFDAYVTQYVIPNQGKVTGYRNFTEGQLLDVTNSTIRKAKALESIKLQLLNGAFVAYGNCESPELSRECAYAISTYLNARQAGLPLSTEQLARLTTLIGYSEGHLKAWVGNTSPYFRPFMGALTVKSIEEVGISETSKASVVDLIIRLADKIWSLWKEEDGPWGKGQSFLYTDRNVGDPDDLKTTPDLNNLITPVFALCYRLTKDNKYWDRAVKSFHGGITVYSGIEHIAGADLGTPTNPRGKVINQNMFWIDRMWKWLEQPVIQTEKEFLDGLEAIIAARKALISR